MPGITILTRNYQERGTKNKGETPLTLFYQASKYMEYFNKILEVYLKCIN